MNIERNIYRAILPVCIAYILLVQMCDTGRRCPDPQVTSVRVDTGYINDQWVSGWQKPKPDTIILPGIPVTQVEERFIPLPYEVYRDTVIYKPVDTGAILQDYFAKAYYRDTLRTQYGAITVEDTISQNRIQARRWATNFTIPTVTKTITLAVPPRNQLYVGFSGLMGQRDIGAEINLSLKTKKDQQYEAGAGLFGTQWYGRVGTKFKLSFK